MELVFGHATLPDNLKVVSKRFTFFQKKSS